MSKKPDTVFIIGRDDAEEWTLALGQMASGTWRQIALAKKLGVPQSLGLTTEQWVNDRLGGYVRLNIAERREAVAELAAEGHSTREIGEVLGMDHSTIVRDTRGGAKAPAATEATQGDAPVSGADAPPQTEPAKPVDTIAALAVTEKMRDAAPPTPDDPHNHRAQGTGENEWYTPAEYIEAARACMGAIDLDPASSDAAQRTVKANRFFTIADDGLVQPWVGRVWLNPPYAQPAIADFVRKLVDELDKGNIDEAVLLTHNYTDTAWFQQALSQASAVCFTRGRIGFLSPDGTRASPTQGQAFFYFGSAIRVKAFAQHFEPFGLVVTPL